MKRRLQETHRFAKALNVYLFLFVLVGLAVMMIDDLLPNRSYPEPEIRIRGDQPEEKDTDRKADLADLEYLRHVDGNAVFALKRKFIHPIQGEAVLAMMSSRWDSVSPERSIVNLLISKDGVVRRVFDNDTWIIAIEYPLKGSEHMPSLSRIVLTVISEDTNSDGYLRMDDEVDLYTVDADGENLKKIMDGVESFELAKSETLIIRKSEGFMVEYYEYNLEVNGLEKVVSGNRKDM